MKAQAMVSCAGRAGGRAFLRRAALDLVVNVSLRPDLPPSIRR
jgi:hypothetical protein